MACAGKVLVTIPLSALLATNDLLLALDQSDVQRTCVPDSFLLELKPYHRVLYSSRIG